MWHKQSLSLYAAADCRHCSSEEGSHVGVDDPVLHAVCTIAVQSKTYSTISAKLQLRRYTSAFKLKSNCNLPAVSMSWICTGPVGPAPRIAPVPAKIPFLSADTFLTNPTNAQKSGLNSTSPDISVEKVIKYLNISDRRMA